MMRFIVVAAVVGSLVVCVSCVENEPPPATNKPVTILSAPASAQPAAQPQAVAQRPRESRPAPSPSRAERSESRQPTLSADGTPVPPKGAQYTIFCGRIQGDAHVERANRVKNELISRTGLRDFYVIHENQQSLLYYGFYRTFNDPKDQREASRAQADLKRVKALESDGNRLFGGAVFVDLEAPDPQAPPEWNLANARGVWSLQIAAYKDSPQRKEAAVEAVREARAQGIEAYYYHGESVSSVCIGAWPEQAVRVHTAAEVKTSSTEDILVTPPGLENVTGLRGRKDNMKVINERVEVADGTLQAAMDRYPHHAINGEHLVRRVNGREVYEPSLLIRIPEPDLTPTARTSGPPEGFNPSAFRGEPVLEQGRAGDIQATPAAPPAGGEQRRPPPPAPQPGLGRLKSIDG